MDKKFDVQKSITLISERFDSKEYITCGVFLMDCKTKIIVVGEKNSFEVMNILEDIQNIRAGYDALTIAYKDCYIHKSMIHNDNVYLSVMDFLNDYPIVKDMYLETKEYEIF